MKLKDMLRRLRFPQREEAELDEEIRSFYDAMEARRVEQGLPPAEAHRAVRAEYGPPASAKEAVRDASREAAFHTVWQDLRYSFRLLGHNPGFAAVAVLSLALGIGANTAIFSLMESVLLRSLPVKNPESLVIFNWHGRVPQEADNQFVHVVHKIQGRFWPGERGTLVTGIFPYGAFETLHRDNPYFSTVFGYFDGRRANLVVAGQANTAQVHYVTGGFFQGLGVASSAGRLIAADDDRPGAEPVAVLSFAASQQRFGGPARAIGQSIRVDNTAFTVIGVTPPAFFGVDPATAAAILLLSVMLAGYAPARRAARVDPLVALRHE